VIDDPRVLPCTEVIARAHAADFTGRQGRTVPGYPEGVAQRSQWPAERSKRRTLRSAGSLRGSPAC
jgi:hypothetical protein